MIPRRRMLALMAASFSAIGSAALGCKKEPRCAHCGMKLDPASAWTTELTGPHPEKYDTPRCALTAWRKGEHEATGVRVVEYYDRVARDGADVAFVVGSDVLGPMGPDVVPVAPDRVDRFVKDHGGKKLTLAEVTAQVLEDPK
jgi:copper chaperone NosL